MKYATWKVSFSSGNDLGTTPDSIIRSKGGNAQGMFEHGLHTIVGMYSDDADVSSLEEWSFTTITTEQALEIAKSYNENCVVNLDGSISAPFIKEA